MTTDHAQSLRLGQRGTAPTPGVQLVTIATLPEVAYRGQIVYALDVDEFRVYDGDAWQIPTAAAEGGTQTFVQALTPVADNVGDLWMNTSTYQLKVWDGTAWQLVQDQDADARDLYTWKLGSYLIGFGVNATTRIYYIGTDPTGNVDWTVVNGHWWYKTDTNQLYRRVTGSWVEVVTAGVPKIFGDAGFAQAIGFDQSIDVYFQSGIPWANGTPNHGEDMGDLWFDTDDSNKMYGFNGVWTLLAERPVVQATIAAQNAQTAADQAQADADQALEDANTDGVPPASSPTPLCEPSIGLFFLKWLPIVNNDPVRYEVHVSAISGFTADSSTYVGETASSKFAVRQMPGVAPAPGDPDPRILDYNTTYYASIIARDGDGAAAQSAQVECTIVQATGVDLAADSVTAQQIVANSLTGDLFSANLLLAGTIKTAEDGQRVELGIDGLKAYKPDNSIMVSLPTTEGEEGLIDAEVIARGLTVTGGASFQSTDNELVADASFTLMRGIVSPSATPTIAEDYERFQLSTAGLSSANKQGVMGNFDLVPGEVSQIEYKGTYWVIHQIRPGGTRSWFFDLSGNPVQLTSPSRYFDDHINWQIWSTTELTTSAVSARNGVYTMFKYVPDGRWYLNHPAGLGFYQLSNPASIPIVGHNADDIYVGEVTTGGQLSLNYYRPVGNIDVGGTGTAPFANRASSVSTYNGSVTLCAVPFSAAGFGVSGASDRYAVAQRNTGALVNLLVKGAANNVLYPGSSGENWASANKDAESFESPGTQRRGFAHDGTNFWSYHADGYLYKHTNEYWNTNGTSSKVWARATFYDSDSTGGTHETTPGTAVSYNYKRRSRFTVMLPTPPDNGGTNDPDSVRLYLGRGSTQPANGSMWLQYTGLGPTTVTTLTTSGTNPPTVNNFPSSTPALIRNDDDTAYLKGDGAFRAVTGQIGTEKILTEGAFYYGYMSAATSNITTATNTVITGWTAGDPNETGETTDYNISLSSGVFTVTKAGWYRVNVGLYWNTTSATGVREVYFYRGNTGGTQALWSSVAGSTTTFPISRFDRMVYLQASGQFRIICFQNSGGTLALMGDNSAGTAGRYSYINVDWVRS